jgi:small-conductance mechanosensitive channel
MDELLLAIDGWKDALGVLVGALLLGFLARGVLFRRLKALSARTETRTDDALLEATRRFWLPAILLAAILPATRLSPLEVEQRVVVERFALSALLLVITLAGSRFAGLWLRGVDVAEGGPARPSVIQKVAQIGILLAGAILILDNAGVEIKTLLTALGVGSLAVALALQPTLSNLFAGIHLSTSKPIRVGDFVELEDGTQGRVADIGWRATRIEQLSGSLVIVPNARLSDMRLINYSQPALPQAIVFPIGVAYDSDLEKVERAAVEVAREIQRSVPEADPEHEPFVRFHTFGASSIDANVILRSRAFTDRFPIVHAYVKALKARFDVDGIEIPFPQRVVHFPAREETAGE